MKTLFHIDICLVEDKSFAFNNQSKLTIGQIIMTDYDFTVCENL